MTTGRPVGWLPPRKHNLPAEVGTFVGRERELADIQDALLRTRLLTLTGVGGCGKTQLALRAAADLVPRFADGVWLVPLAPLMDAALVPRALAAALGVSGRSDQPILESLVAALATRKLLLVLDNCEHLIAASAQLAEVLLHGGPHLHILATSREPLRVPGEMIRRVPPLALPTPGSHLSPELLAQVEAVRLFVDRARARYPAFCLSIETAPPVTEICRRLEGLPLAIELAAAHLGALALDQIASQLHDSLRLLGGGRRTTPRQETLRATLDWSHMLLRDAERVLFRRVSVFAGSFGVQAAEHICSDAALEPDAVLTLLMALIEKSLVEARIDGQQARYRLLEPVRQYAWEHLVREREAAALQRRHAHHYVELAEAAEPELMSANRGAAIERLLADQDNMRAALAWSRQSGGTADRELGLRLAAALFWFWNFRGDVSEGLEWLEALLARAPGVPPIVRAGALHAAGELTWLMGHDTLARSRLEESATLYRVLGDKRGLAYDLQALAMLCEQPAAQEAAAESLRLFEEVGDAWGAAHATSALWLLRATGPDAERALEEALCVWRAIGDPWGIAQHLNMLGDIARTRGDDARATALYEEALGMLRQAGLPGTVPSLLHNLGYLALRAGDARRGLRLFRESLVLFRDQGDQRGIADCLEGLAGVLGAMKQPERGARLFGAAAALREETGASVWPANAADVARSLASVRDQLDEAAFGGAWSAGRMQPLEHALREALAAERLDQAGAAPERDDLTPREREVAILVAQGLTNRQIGRTLVITEGTARLHVKHALQKLGVSSRAQIAAWAVAQGIAHPNTTTIPLPG